MHFWGIKGSSDTTTPLPTPQSFSWQEAEQTQAFIFSSSPESNLPQ